MLTVSQPFTQAVSFLSDKVPKGSPFSSAQWTAQAPDIRVKSFFSAGIESTRFLERGQTLLDDCLTKGTEEVTDSKGNKSTRLKVGSRADFNRKMREFMLREGMAKESDFKGSQTDIRNITKLSRLNLIFDTSIRQSFGFGRWKQSMNPAVLDAFPAARFTRLPGSREKRPRHRDGEGDVRLKTDVAYWSDWQNDPAIGGFGVPWSPFGFNSNMTTRDVSRKTAERLKLIRPGQRVTPPEPAHVTDDVQADLTDVDPAIVDQFIDYIKPVPRVQVVPVKPKPVIVDTKPIPTIAPRVVPPTNFVPTPMPSKPVPMQQGMTAFILPPIIPQIVLNGTSFVFFMGSWRSLTGDDKDLAELNEFAGELNMMDKIKKAFGDAVSF